MTEFYQKLRPTKWKQMIGQEAAVSQLVGMCKKKKVPHAQLYSGPSGVGKTTAARIMLTHLECEEGDSFEINAATERGIGGVRDIQSHQGRKPWGESRVWIIDEADQLTKDSQRGMLKVLEDCPPHAYFILCTTDPQRLLPTIRTRCSEIKFGRIASDDLEELLDATSKHCKFRLVEKVRDKIVKVSDGSARKALVILHQISEIKKIKLQLKAVQEGDTEAESNELAKLLIKPQCDWVDVKKFFKGMKANDAESVRRIVLAYASTQLINGWGNPFRAELLIGHFYDNFFDSGLAGLVLAARKCCTSGTKPTWQKRK